LSLSPTSEHDIGRWNDAGAGPSKGPARRRRRQATRRRRRRRAIWLATITVVLAGIAGGVAVATSGGQNAVVPACTVSDTPGGGVYQLTPDQGQNAAIIAAVGLKMGLPDHAVTVALATALQESELANLPYGDLDSVGLFQQRPSQGWGSRAQILDPEYAASAFYSHLVQVPGWSTMAVTEAAQAVQHSAAPSAYAQWEPEARALAVALTGETPAAFTCRLSGFAGPAPAPSALAAAADNELGPGRLDAPGSTKAGWVVASWVVAHAWQYHINEVRFDGWTWTLHSGRWTQSSSSSGSDTVTYD
jgi:hypothetical protein